MREIEAYKMFKSEYIIRLVDSAVIQERDGSKVVHIVLPYYRRGNLQDVVNEHAVNGTHFDEDKLIKLFIEISKGIRVLHKHRMPAVTTTRGSSGTGINAETDDGEGDNAEEMGLLSADAANDAGDEEGTALGEMVPYAHRDIKPANVMIGEKGRCVLVDLGSTARARIHVRSRQEALVIQDGAAEHCTLPYRAPELFDVKTDAHIDERVDIWSLGCTFFALMYGSSPFELQAAENGASVNMAILSGQYRFPASPEYSQDLRDIVTRCLSVDPTQRPDIDEVLSAMDALHR
jgi:serine/threonine kinase 16